MRNRLSSWWYDIQDSLWFTPAAMTAGAAILAVLMVRIDQELVADGRPGPSWLFEGGAAGARGVLAAIAGTMVTVTATVFSITIVALQLASSQFTPRVLRTFTGDRGNQVVLGAFIGTFTYALLVLRAVRSAPEDGQAFVPSASVTMAIVLALASIGFLIYYIHHAARSIQAAVVIDRAAADTLNLIERLYPAEVDHPEPPAGAESFVPTAPPAAVPADGGGYLQHVAEDALVAVAEECRRLVRLESEVGDFVLPGATLASIWPADPPDADPDACDSAAAVDRVRAAFIFGPERTLAEDVELGFRQLADIALKALSPGINDPTTATMCVDRLAEALVQLGRRGEPVAVRRGADGCPRLLRRGPAFGRLVEVAFGQVRHYGAGDAAFAVHLASILGRSAALLPPRCWEPCAREGRLLVAEARGRIRVPEDVARVEAAAAWAADVAPSPPDRVTVDGANG